MNFNKNNTSIATGMECLRTFVCYLNVKKCLNLINIVCIVKQTIINPKKKVAPRIGRVTEVILSQGCLFLFALSLSLLSGLPVYFLRDWLPSLNQSEYIVFFSAYLLLVPVAFLGARQSLRMLKQVEELSGRRVSFQRRLRKLRRRERRLTRFPQPGPVTLTKVEWPQRNAQLTNQKIFSPAQSLGRKSLKEIS